MIRYALDLSYETSSFALVFNVFFVMSVDVRFMLYVVNECPGNVFPISQGHDIPLSIITPKFKIQPTHPL